MRSVIIVFLAALLCTSCKTQDSSQTPSQVELPPDPGTSAPPPSGGGGGSTGGDNSGGSTSSPGIGGETPIQSEFDYRTYLQPSSAGIPPSAAPDVVGAFRFICLPGQISYDDPIVFPGQPGLSHLHQYYGNTKADAFSTYRSLRTTGESTCMSPLNRSGYWMPAMLDGKGNVVRPDYVTIYYKRRPKSDPKCSLTSGDPQAEGNCINLPNGLKFVFGWDPTGKNSAKTGAAYFNCDGPTGSQGHYATITEAMAHCPTTPDASGKYNHLGAVISAPSCWDGKNLDSPDHRSHVAYPGYGDWGYLRCPSTHPYVIPTFQLGAWYTVDQNLGTWRLSSDAMVPGAPPGYTFHADFFMAWDPNAVSIWHDNCIDKMLNCSGGVLGDGEIIKQVWPFRWDASPRLVPVPAMPAPMAGM